jgi:hypothetical protein
MVDVPVSSHGWAVVVKFPRTTWLIPWTVERTRRESIERYLQGDPISLWEARRRKGLVRCAKVSISTLEEVE